MQADELKLTVKNLKPLYKHCTFYTATIPSYVGGPMAFGWASDKKYRTSEETLRARLENVEGELYYYTPAVHKASFALPGYMLSMMK